MKQGHTSRTSGREPSLSAKDHPLQLTGLEPSISGEVALLTLLTNHQQGSTRWDQSACDQLRQMGKDVLPSLLHLLHDKNWRIRRASAVAIGVINDPEAVPDLLMALRDRHPAVRNAAEGSLRKIGRAAVPGLIALLGDDDRDVHLRSVKLLGAIRDTRAVPRLLELFDELFFEEFVYFNDCLLIDVLFAFRDRDVLRSLVQIAFAKQGHWWAQVLDKLKDTKSWQSDPDLVHFLFESLKSADPDLISCTIDVLISISDKRAAPALIQALQDSNELVHHYAIFALSNIGDRRVIPELIAMLSSASASSRYWAIVKLIKLNDPRAVPALEKALDDTEESVKQHAAAGLWASGHERARQIISDYLRHPVRGERRHTILALASTKNPDVMPYIEAGLRDKDTKQAAICALGEFRNSKEAFSLVESAIRGETSEDVLREAIEAFTKIGRPEAIPILKSLLLPHSAVSWYANNAIAQIKRARHSTGRA